MLRIPQAMGTALQPAGLTLRPGSLTGWKRGRGEGGPAKP